MTGASAEILSVMQEQPVILLAVAIKHSPVHRLPVLQCLIEVYDKAMQAVTAFTDFQDAVCSMGRFPEYTQEYAVIQIRTPVRKCVAESGVLETEW